MAELLQVDCEMFGLSSDHYSVTLRRYAGMALTNLTFGDVANKVRVGFKQLRLRMVTSQLTTSCFLSGHTVLHEGLHEGDGRSAEV